MLLATLTALALVAPQGADTTVAVQRGDRLEVENHMGSIAVRTWNRNEVMVRGRGGRYSVDRSRGEVTVETDWEGGPSGELRLEITAPAWMALDLSGVNTSISIVGAGAAVNAENVTGDITLEGGDGNIQLETVEGRIMVSGTRGRIAASAVNQNITIRNASGPLSVESVNGTIELLRVESADVSAETVNGSITLSGPLREEGRYQLSTHNGNVTVGVQEGAGVTVSVSTFQGELSADFPVSVRGSRDGDFSFTLGNGRSRLDIETFQGQIRLVRPGTIRSR